MLTKEAMVAGWTLLHERFGNKASEAILKIYYTHLRTRLTDLQWEAAVNRVILEDQFFPSAQALLDKVLPSVTEQAEKAWEQIYLGAQRGQRPELSETAMTALQNIGGFRAIELASERELSHLRRQFFESFTNHSETKNKPNELPPDTPPQLP